MLRAQRLVGNAQLQSVVQRFTLPIRDPLQAYRHALIAATAKLGDSQEWSEFGRAEERAGFDHNWEKEDDEDPNVKWRLRLRKGVSPTRAVYDWFDNPQVWSLDCAQAVQFPQLYAKIKYLEEQSPDKDRPFDDTVKGLVFYLKPHRSTGLVSKLRFERNSPGAAWRRFDWVDGKALLAKSTVPDSATDELLDEAPIGSEVTWSNVKAGGTPWQAENTTKISQHLFAAHPLGVKPRDYIEDEMWLRANTELKTLGRELSSSADVFLSGLEDFAIPDPLQTSKKWWSPRS